MRFFVHAVHWKMLAATCHSCQDFFCCQQIPTSLFIQPLAHWLRPLEAFMQQLDWEAGFFFAMNLFCSLFKMSNFIRAGCSIQVTSSILTLNNSYCFSKPRCLLPIYPPVRRGEKLSSESVLSETWATFKLSPNKPQAVKWKPRMLTGS